MMALLFCFLVLFNMVALGMLYLFASVGLLFWKKEIGFWDIEEAFQHTYKKSFLLQLLLTPLEILYVFLKRMRKRSDA